MSLQLDSSLHRGSHGKTRRTLLRSGALLCAGLAAAPLLAACTGSALATTATSSAAATGTIAGSSAASGDSSAAVQPNAAAGAITWLVPEDPLIDKFANDGIVPSFQKDHPATKVNVITPGSSAYVTKLLALVSAGTTPEVFATWGGSSFFTVLHHNLLTDLSTYFQQSGTSPTFVQQVYLDEYTVQGKLYGVPWNSNPNFIVYNKTLFQKYGVPLPPSDWKDKNWTTDALLQAAKGLTHDTGNPATSTFGVVMAAGTDGSLSWLWNADPFNDKGGPEDSAAYHGAPLTAVYATRQPVVDAMTWFADLTNKYQVSPSPTDAKAMSAQGNPIFSGRLGMAAEAGGWLERQAAVAAPKFEWGIAPFPYGPGGKHTMQREDSAWYVGQGSKNPDAGFQLILYSARGPGADALISYAKNNPPLTDTSYLNKWADAVLKIPGLAMTKQEFTAVFEGGIQEGFPDPTNVLDNGNELADAFTQIMAPVWLGKQTPLAGLQVLQQKWQGIIQAAKPAS